MTDLSAPDGSVSLAALRSHGLDPAAERLASERKIRCRLLNGQLNRCPNEALSEDGLALCAKHYARAVRDYCALTGGKLVISGGRVVA